MAFSKTAAARIIKPSISMDAWKAMHPTRTRTASKIVLPDYNPEKFLLTHCSIMASVDTEVSPEPLGTHLLDGFQVDRQFSDWLVTPDTSKYINANEDCWERKLLLSSFPTFIGGENYLEHVQIPELSKGKIIDAASRDIGESVYIDLLVATDIQHTALITAIQRKRLSTLSMGCNVMFTICTKCGNVAYDETQLCPHIKYEKGATWVDANGITRKVSELCGHISKEPGSVVFIEASWVGNPAFKGAVVRNTFDTDQAKLVSPQKLQVVFESPRPVVSGKLDRAASTRISQDFDFGGDESAKEESAAPKAKEEDPIHKAVSDLVTLLKDKAVDTIRQEITQQDTKAVDENLNDTIIKSAMKHPSWKRLASYVSTICTNTNQSSRTVTALILYKSGGWSNVRKANLTKRESLAFSRLVSHLQGTPKIAGELRLCRTIIAVDGLKKYSNIRTFLDACRQVIGRSLTKDEAKYLVAKGRIFDLGH